MNENMMKIPDIAKLLDVHESTVWRWLDSGALVGVRAGGLWRIRESALNAFLERDHEKESE